MKQIEGVNSNKRGINELALAEEIERLEIKEENIQDVRDELEKKSHQFIEKSQNYHIKSMIKKEKKKKLKINIIVNIGLE